MSTRKLSTSKWFFEVQSVQIIIMYESLNQTSTITSSYFRHLKGEIGNYAVGYLHLYAKWGSYSHKMACLKCLFLLVLLWASAAAVADSFVRYIFVSKIHVLAILPRFLLHFNLLISWPKTG